MNLARHVSLFDVEDTVDAPRVRDCTVGHVSTRDVDEFCHRYHYTATGGTATWRYGLWHGPTLWGVVAYNRPTPEVCKSVFGAEHGPEHVWHMGRLVLPDQALSNSESRLIGGSLRFITAEHPEVWAVLTYAAPGAGHIGYVYQATNAIYTGMTKNNHPYYYIDTAGRRRPENQTKINGSSYLSPARAAAMGWTQHTEPPKHRYLYILGDRRQRRERRKMLRYPVFPYPKADTG